MRFLRLIWRYSLIVTLPVSLLFATWGLRTLQLYYAEYQFGRLFSIHNTLRFRQGYGCIPARFCAESATRLKG